MIEIKNLSIKIKGESIIDGLSLDIDDQDTYAVFMGKGCGKTALASALCGALEADSGEILIDGEIIDTENSGLKSRIGFYSADMEIPKFMSIREVLSFIGRSRGASPEDLESQVDEALALVELDEIDKCSVATLTPCQRAYLGVAMTLVGKPSLIVYDDIFKGLDKKETAGLSELLKMISSKKRVLLICSTPVAAATFCTHAVFVKDSKVLLNSSIENIEREIRKTREMRISVRGSAEAVSERILKLPEVIKTTVGSEKGGVVLLSVEYRDDDKIKDKLFAAMAEISSPILSYEEVSVSISDVYHTLISDKRSDGEGGAK